MRPTPKSAFQIALIAAMCSLPSITQPQSQPLSQSMAECGGMMLAAAEFLQDPEHQRELVRRAQEWASAGVEQARSEGHVYPDFFVESTFRSAFEDWLTEGDATVLSEEFRDWNQYCQSLADARGLDLAQG